METISTTPAIPEKVRWSSGAEEGHVGHVGMFTESDRGVNFITWGDLKPELEQRLLIQLGRILGSRTHTVDTAEFHGRKNWLIRIVNDAGKAVGSVWLGGNPNKNWQWDGVVRVGNAPDEHTAKVWQDFERYSDGSYRRIGAYDTPADRVGI